MGKQETIDYIFQITPLPYAVTFDSTKSHSNFARLKMASAVFRRICWFEHVYSHIVCTIYKWKCLSR